MYTGIPADHYVDNQIILIMYHSPSPYLSLGDVLCNLRALDVPPLECMRPGIICCRMAGYVQEHFVIRKNQLYRISPTGKRYVEEFLLTDTHSDLQSGH